MLYIDNSSPTSQTLAIGVIRYIPALESHEELHEVDFLDVHLLRLYDNDTDCGSNNPSLS